MKSKFLKPSLLSLAFALAVLCPWAVGQSKVVVRKSGEKFLMVRNGQPYRVRGVGGSSDLKRLADAGGNSIRTWSTDNLGPLLDEAHRHGLSVCVGIWLGHQRHGFDYQNETAVLQQLDDSLAAVQAFKDHPAVLMWGIGNEMEGEGTNPAIWYAVEHIARECRRIDPNHPTMTVIAELGDHKIQSIERFCPSIDIIGVNTYGGIDSMPKRYREAGGSKPYIVTEHGPRGPWEVEKTSWGAPLESTSTAKAARYADGYRIAVTEQPDICLGSYAFLWGHKQETTATWFGMLLQEGNRLAAVDAMSEAWTGTPPANRCPRIESLTVDRTSKLKPGESIVAKLDASDPDDDPLKVRWVLRHDAVIVGIGGDSQSENLSVDGAVSGSETGATIKVPSGGGGYRLFAYVFDTHGGAAVANVPLHVDAPVKRIPSPKAQLPFVVYGDDASQGTYAPSGYMGNAQSIVMSLGNRDSPHSGDTCLKVQYKASDQWGGVLWQSPANDWEGCEAWRTRLKRSRVA